MRKRTFPLILAAALTASLAGLAACTTGHGAVGVNLAAGGPDYYDGYYDGFYGPFNDGYWGNDGAFWYSDSASSFHRDEGHHFAHVAGTTGMWNHVHGSGMHREHWSGPLAWLKALFGHLFR